MPTEFTTRNPVRSDVPATAPVSASRPGPRLWAVAGIGAALAGAATVVTTSMAGTVYEPRFAGDVTGLADAMTQDASVLLVFHTVTMIGAVLTLVFAAGLHRRLSDALGAGGTVPLLAFAGLFGTVVVSVLGTGLDTEYVVPMLSGQSIDDASAAAYGHWTGTIPWVWVLCGVTAVSLYVAARQGALPRWLGRTGLVLGGLVLVLGVSPLQYMAVVPGVLWLLVTSVGLLIGDRSHRGVA